MQTTRLSARITGVAAVVALALAGCAGQKPGAPHHTAPRPQALALVAPAGSPVVRITIPLHARPIPIPASFLGLSTEYWTLPVDERHIALYSRVISLLHVPGDGPFVLRIGGDSSDHAFFDPHVLHLPRWAFDLTPEFIARTARIVRDLHLRVILDLNLVTATPRLATAWVAEAQKVMPPGSIIGYEVGNEPNLYSRVFWLLATQDDRFTARILPRELTPDGYLDDYDTYARLIGRIAPGVPLLAPAVSNTFTALRWIRALLSRPHLGLAVISGHRYPYSACAFPGSPLYPTIERILSQQASAGMAASVRPMVALAHRAGLSARLTEFNSVTCGGLRGVSDSFATALWAPDVIFELIRTGLAGVNLHARVFSVNDPFTFDARGLVTRPLLYGLILFTRTLGPDARRVPLTVIKPPALNVKAWAVAVAGGRLHVLMLDKGPRWVTIDLSLPARSVASVQRLLAPSPSARTGETLAGQVLDPDGAWSGVAHLELVQRGQHGYALVLPPYSAALLSVLSPPGPIA